MPIYTTSQLRLMKRDDARKIAAQLKISNIPSKKKDQLIDIIIKTQDRRQEITNPRLPKQDEPEDSDISELKMSQRFHRKIRTFKYIPNSESLIDVIHKLYPKLIYIANKHLSYKLSIDLRATFQSPEYNDSTFYIQSKRYTKFETDRLDNILKDLKNGIDTKNTVGSGWKVTSIDEVSLNISEFAPLKGSSYSELPDFKNAILNIYNEDDQCFLHSILAFLFLRPTDFNKSHYKSYTNLINRLDTSMLRFQQKLSSNIEKFEKANNLIINVYSVENKTIVPVRISTNRFHLHAFLK